MCLQLCLSKYVQFVRFVSIRDSCVSITFPLPDLCLLLVLSRPNKNHVRDKERKNHHPRHAQEGTDRRLLVSHSHLLPHDPMRPPRILPRLRLRMPPAVKVPHVRAALVRVGVLSEAHAGPLGLGARRVGGRIGLVRGAALRRVLAPAAGAVEARRRAAEGGAAAREARGRAPAGGAGAAAVVGAAAGAVVVVVGGGEGAVVGGALCGGAEDGVGFCYCVEFAGCGGVVWVMVWVVSFGEGVEGSVVVFVS